MEQRITKAEKRRSRKPRREVSGVKETDNLFMDGWSWDRFNRRIDEAMTERGLPPEKTPTFMQAEPA